MRRAAVSVALLVLTTAVAHADPRQGRAARLLAFPDSEPERAVAPAGSYPLDAVPRDVPEDVRRVRCDRDALVVYRGTTMRLNRPITIHPAFQSYVERFERLVAEVAREHYGRAPRTLSHQGGFVCRTIRRERSQLSEHAFGNAIDVRGFGFYAARSDEPLSEGIPSHLRRSFVVRVEDHWTSDREVDAAHVAFFAKLRARLERTTDLFQVMLGPSFPGHDRHLHLDRAPSRYVQF